MQYVSSSELPASRVTAAAKYFEYLDFMVGKKTFAGKQFPKRYHDILEMF